ncbi:MAG: response regulator [Chitinophagaceae bacterium]|nr:response regulator [Chitinophagaceae bacterium]
MIDSPLNILVVEDNAGDYILVREYLEEILTKSTILHADTLAHAAEILEKNKIDVVLLDLTLPDGMGKDSFMDIYSKASEIPIIVLTGFGDTEMALETLKLGAQDYIVKGDSNPIVLAKSIQYSIERSKIFDQLKKSEEQYKYLFQSNPLPMFALKKGTFQFLMANQAAINHYGYTEEEFFKMTFKDLGQKNASNQNGDLTFTNKVNENPDIKHVKKDGTIIDVELGFHDVLLQGEDERLIVIHDVTERNRAKEQLRESEQMFRTISENFPNGSVAILDRELKILYTAGKEFHVPDTDPFVLENTIYTSHFNEETSKKVKLELEKVFNGNSNVFEAGYQSLSYIISAVPLFEKDNSINKILLATQNISEQKKNETEKELLIEELMHNNNDLKQFSYITSHNLRAPLSNLLGIIKLIDLSSITDPMTSLLLKNFKECTLQLNETVNDLINVLIIKNNVNTKKETLSIPQTFEKVISSVQNTIDNFNAQIEHDFNDVDKVEFNKSYLESILLNLLTNALKYSSPDRRPFIRVYTKKIDEVTKLYFSDNGLGIDMARHKNKIFGLYQRFHDHADSKGLGLYMVNSQIIVMGGEIEVVSEVDKGSTFVITFKN